MERLSLPSLMAMTFTLTLSPTARTADGCLIRLAQIWEMWTRPERPFPRLMNAPYGCRLSTVGNFLFALYVCFLAENFAGGENQTVFFFVKVKNLNLNVFV